MIGSIHVQLSGAGTGSVDSVTEDTKAIQHSVEQVLLSTIRGLSEVAVQIEKEGMGGFQSCFCNGSRLRDGGALKKEGFSNMPWTS